jgi:hypothetical protein
VVRARRVQQRGDDSVIKLRPVVPYELPPDVRRSKDLVVEVDAMPGGYVCAASLNGTIGTTDVKRVAAGERAISKLFSKEQRAFFAAHAPEGIGLDDLSMLGPITLLKLSSRQGNSAEGWSPSCGCTPTARGSPSCPPGARRARRSSSRSHPFGMMRGTGSPLTLALV